MSGVNEMKRKHELVDKNAPFQFCLFALHTYIEHDTDIPIKFTLSRRMIGAYNYSFVGKKRVNERASK